MDEISLLRRARTDIPERTPANVARGRAALFAQIEAETVYAPFAGLEHATPSTLSTPQPLKRHRRRTVAWTGFSALGAGALTIVLVGVNVLGIGGWDGAADPAAADALNAAAIATLEVSDPQLTPGQFLRVRTDAVYMTPTMLDANADGEASDLNETQTPYSMQKEHSELFRPADRNDTWWWIQCRAVDQTPSPTSELAPRQDLAMTDDVAGFLQELPGGRSRYELPDGKVKIGNPVGGFTVPGGASDDFTQLPLDPDELLRTIHRLNGDSGPSRDGQALVWIADTLRSGTIPAEYRAAIYQAAALIPGVTITDQQATLDGTTGIALGRDETTNSFRQEIIIDPATGRFIGERRVQTAESVDVPAGTPIGWTAVTTEVVDAAPTDVSTCST